MRHEQAVVPSPLVNTYLNLQSPDGFDAVVIQPDVNTHPEFGVIFLHEYMGNVTAQCWEIAQAVSRFGAVTICPSTDWQGRWWQPQGVMILNVTFDYLRSKGIQKIVLSGFSNGGFGISRMTAALQNETDLSGLIFVDGISNGEAIKELGLPVLTIQGSQDERMPAAEARRIAEIIGESGTYVELESDHFLIMKQPGAVQNAIAPRLPPC